MDAKKWQGGTREEYETQYFGFGAQTLQIATRRMIEENISSCIQDMEKSLKDKLHFNESDSKSVSESCKALTALYFEKAKPSLDIIDKEIDKTINIPSNTLLPEDESKTLQLRDEEYEKLVSDVSSLQSSLKRAALMETLLMGQLEELRAAEPAFQMAASSMKLVDGLSDSLQTHNGVLKSIVSETEFLTANVDLKEDIYLSDTK